MQAKDEQLFQAASTGNISTISSILAEYSPSQDTLQTAIVKAIHPNANSYMVTELLHRRFPDLPLSEEMIRWSCYAGSIPIAEAILTKDPQAYTDPFLHHGRQAPLFAAAVICYHGKLDAVAAMVDHGVNLQHQNLLLGAVGHGYLELAQYLLSHGITPENDQSMDNQSKTPVLHMAVSDGNIRMVRLLLEYGAKADVKNGRDLTTVQVAEEMHYWETAALLKGSLG